MDKQTTGITDTTISGITIDYQRPERRNHHSLLIDIVLNFSWVVSVAVYSVVWDVAPTSGVVLFWSVYVADGC